MPVRDEGVDLEIAKVGDDGGMDERFCEYCQHKGENRCPFRLVDRVEVQVLHLGR